ncbi:hypothetical protein [Buttiauxella sp. B2]|nr:hypothetical protein [Buttiauxella sp. B2]
MTLTKEEAELISGFIAAHWPEFAADAEEVISICALHRLAEKLGLSSDAT